MKKQVVKKALKYILRYLLMLGTSSIVLIQDNRVFLHWLKKVLAKKMKTLESQPVLQRSIEKKLQVLQVNTTDNKGGAAKVAWRIKESLRYRGHRASMLVGHKSSDDKEVFVVTEFIKDFFFWGLCRKRGLQFNHILSTFDIPLLPVFKEADILHLHNLHGEYFNYLALPGLTRLKPVVWTLHDMQAITGHCAHSLDCERWHGDCGKCDHLDYYPALDVDSSSAVLQEKKTVYEQCRFTIVTPSRWLQEKVEKSILGRHDVRLIYNGIDTAVFRPLPTQEIRRRYGIARDELLFLTSSVGGQNNPHKGWDYLQKAVEQLRIKRDFVMVCIGSEEKTETIDGIKWIYTGHLSDEKKIAEWYSTANLFLFPSIAENFPLVLLEAMACGLPAVVFDTGGIPEIIEHKSTGYIARYKDVEDFISGIEFFISDRKKLKEASAAVLKRVSGSFTQDRMMNEYMKLYLELLEK